LPPEPIGGGAFEMEMTEDATKIAITELPKIIDLLLVDGEPCFVVLMYNQFVKFAAIASPNSSPDVVSVLNYNKEHAFVIISYDEFRRYIKKLDVVGDIDETHYLERHKDVKIAIEQGMLRSGTQHYILQGYFERREVRIPIQKRSPPP
jgi:hypothetical protein